jgi:hypothetical protein
MLLVNYSMGKKKELEELSCKENNSKKLREKYENDKELEGIYKKLTIFFKMSLKY